MANATDYENLSDVEFEQYVEDLKAKQREYRSTLVLYQNPIMTLWRFVQLTKNKFFDSCYYLVSNPYFSFAGVPLLLIYLGLHYVEGPHQEHMFEVDEFVLWAGWWLGLGVLSSIGLGTGMHSGMMFLFPHIAEVCLCATECQSLNFATRGADAFVCLSRNDGISLFGIFLKVFIPCFFWGSGTAMGEIPPYWISYAAAVAGEEDEEFEKISGLRSEKSDRPWYDPRELFNRMQLWMLDVLQIYGFTAILLFAAWPNLAFDLCGIACGHFKLSFWTFFGATYIGKALIKVNMQALFFILIFSEHLVEHVLNALSYWDLHRARNIVSEFLNDQRDHFQGKKFSADPGAPVHEPTLIARAWSYFMILLIAAFATSMVHSLAQSHQADLDRAEIEEIQKRRLKFE